MIWTDTMGWSVPRFHVDVTEWLPDYSKSRIKVLKMFRGASKSTIVGVGIAHDVYENNSAHILAHGADNKVAAKLSRDARHVVRKHPLCAGLYNRQRWGVFGWSVMGNMSVRDDNVQAAGITSNVTSSRATKAIFDDIEVPRNIKTPEARELLRARASEATHILVPGGPKLYIGTPHTVDSIYEEEAGKGADVLNFPLFANHKRYENEKRARKFGFKKFTTKDDLYVFHNKVLLQDARDFKFIDNSVRFDKAPTGTVDIYSGNTWPQRFTRADLQFRRSECKTVNEWDSQYGLHARPLHNIRLDPDKMVSYKDVPRIEYVNREVVMRLGEVRLVCAFAWWDCAIGKVRGDASALCVVFQDERGNYYWHKAEALLGDLDAQCVRAREILVELQISAINVETNGVGGFVPAMLRKHLHGYGIAVIEQVAVQNKDKKILDGLEGPLSAGMLWAHLGIWDTPAIAQMRDWIPGLNIHKGQPDDYIDAAASAILQTPVRIGKIVGSVIEVQNWRPATGTYTASVER